MLPDFAAFLRGQVDLTGVRPLRVVIDAGNGMGGVVADAALGGGAGLEELPVGIVRLFFEPDGTFPNHPANPLEPANLEDLRRAVVASDADLGLAFDGDADRCFVVDETGALVAPSVIGVIIALREVRREQAAGRSPVVVRNAITSQILPELVEAAGARTVRTRVGHGVIKPVMAEADAVFGAEHSGHFYFRDFFYADSGILTAMHVLAALGSQPLALSQLAEFHTPYAASGEVNFRVGDPARSIQKVQRAYADDAARGVVALDSLDGLTVNHWQRPPRWWANVRPSNTEALLRLNVEAEDRDVMNKVRDGIAGIVEEHT
jgi:phosphomannomutase